MALNRELGTTLRENHMDLRVSVRPSSLATRESRSLLFYAL